MDAARVSKRLGADVYLIYRRSAMKCRRVPKKPITRKKKASISGSLQIRLE
jgi:hypothetical protein